MGILMDAGVVDVIKTNFARQLADGRLVAGEKMPARGGLGLSIAFDVGFFLGGGERRSFGGSMLTLITSN